MSPSTLLRVVTRPIRPQRFRIISTISQTHYFSYSAVRPIPKKYDQDRESMNTESSEHTQSSTDSEAAAQDQAAYDPNRTSPESEMESAQKGNKRNPLEVSGANKDVSKQRHPQEGGAESSPEGERERQSGGGSPKKAGA